MASDNRAPGYQEVNSCPKSSTAKDLSIRKFLSGVKKVGNTTVESLERSYTRSTKNHVQYGKINKKGTSTGTYKKDDTANYKLALRSSGNNSNDMNTTSGEVQIKQEIIHDGLEQQKQTRLTRERTTRIVDSDTIEFIDDADLIAIDFPYDGTDEYKPQRSNHFSDTVNSKKSDRMRNDSDISSKQAAQRMDSSDVEEQDLFIHHDERPSKSASQIPEVTKTTEMTDVMDANSPSIMGSVMESTVHANRRPWVSAGSRKKPKTYFSDIKSLQDEMEQLITDVEMHESDSTVDRETPSPFSNTGSGSSSNEPRQELPRSVGADSGELFQRNGDSSANGIPAQTNHGPTEEAPFHDDMKVDTAPLPDTATMADTPTVSGKATADPDVSKSPAHTTHTGSGHSDERTMGQRKKVSFRTPGIFPSDRLNSGFNVIAKSQPSKKEKLANRDEI